MLANFGGQGQPIRRLSRHRSRSSDISPSFGSTDGRPVIDYMRDQPQRKTTRSKSASAGTTLGDRILRRHEQDYHEYPAAPVPVPLYDDYPEETRVYEPAPIRHDTYEEYHPAPQPQRYDAYADGGGLHFPSSHLPRDETPKRSKKLVKPKVMRHTSPLYCPEQNLEAERAEVAKECQDLRRTRRFSNTKRYETNMYGMSSLNDGYPQRTRKRLVRQPMSGIRPRVDEKRSGLGMPPHRKDAPGAPYLYGSGVTEKQKTLTDHSEIFGDHGRRSGYSRSSNADNDPILHLRGRASNSSPAYSRSTVPVPVPMDAPLSPLGLYKKSSPPRERPEQHSPARSHSSTRRHDVINHSTHSISNPRERDTESRTSSRGRSRRGPRPEDNKELLYDHYEDLVQQKRDRLRSRSQIATRNERREYDDVTDTTSVSSSRRGGRRGRGDDDTSTTYTLDKDERRGFGQLTGPSSSRDYGRARSRDRNTTSRDDYNQGNSSPTGTDVYSTVSTEQTYDSGRRGLRTGYKYSSARDSDPILHLKTPLGPEEPKVSRKGSAAHRSRSAPAVRPSQRSSWDVPASPTKTANSSRRDQYDIAPRGRTVNRRNEPSGGGEWDSASATVSEYSERLYNAPGNSGVRSSSVGAGGGSGGFARRRTSMPGY